MYFTLTPWDCEEGGISTLMHTWNRPLLLLLLLLPGYRASSPKVCACVCAWIAATTVGVAAGSWSTWRRSQSRAGGDWAGRARTPAHRVRVDPQHLHLQESCKIIVFGFTLSDNLIVHRLEGHRFDRMRYWMPNCPWCSPVCEWSELWFRQTLLPVYE